MSHTPGPWEAMAISQVPHLWMVVEPNSKPPNQEVAMVRYSADRQHLAKANARLITAAPELYEAASYLLAHEDADPDDNLDQDTYSEAWEFLKEAVAKAEGGEV